MEYRGRAIAAVRAADESLRAELRTIISDAINAEAYGDVAYIAGIATALSNLRAQFAPGIEDVEPASSGTMKLVGAEWPDSVRASAEDHAALLREVQQRGSRRHQYPQFLRDGDRLVKVAWSKKERQPYEHKAPREIIEVLLKAIRTRRGDHKPFEAADILPLRRDGGEEYPSYQSYLALGWLRHAGVVSKGRHGYLLKRDWKDERLLQLWDALPSVA